MQLWILIAAVAAVMLAGSFITNGQPEPKKQEAAQEYVHPVEQPTDRVEAP